MQKQRVTGSNSVMHERPWIHLCNDISASERKSQERLRRLALSITLGGVRK